MKTWRKAMGWLSPVLSFAAVMAVCVGHPLPAVFLVYFAWMTDPRQSRAPVKSARWDQVDPHKQRLEMQDTQVRVTFGWEDAYQAMEFYDALDLVFDRGGTMEIKPRAEDRQQ